jgi:hypothetical protein
MIRRRNVRHVPSSCTGISVEPEKRTVTGIVFKAAALVLRRGVQS